MRIKKLEIFGFKSFKDRTVIQFDEGITGIVGPNGCGKSNIVDALVWVMGEMSAKHLRGSSMEDVIFAGAEGYAPMGLAEVSLTLENDGGLFPAQYARFSEVMVTRRLSRSGESEYFINKEPARLRDIQEIFMDTGAGSKGFSIIEQGAIGKIITAKAEDRRVLIEEAAGITKFKVRKRESQRKLETTDQNLVRLQDIIGEQKRQIDSLERQAQRAERYRKIKNELQEKELWLSSRNYLSMHEEASQAEKTFIEARDVDAGGEARVAELESRLAALRLSLAEQSTRVQDRQNAHRECLNRVQETEFRVRELNLTMEQAQKSNDRAGSLLSQHQLRRENLQTEKESLESRLQDAREAAVLLESRYENESSEFQGLQERITQADRELTEKRREMLTVSAGLSQLEARHGVVQTKAEAENQKWEQIRVAQEGLKAQKVEFEERRNRVFRDLERERQMQLDLTRDVELVEQNLASLRAQIASRRNEHEEFRNELNEVASRLYGLENLQSNFEGFETGVKNVLMWQRARPQEDATLAFKPLSEVVEVPERYELAMEASLGTRLQMLLSHSSEQALGAVDYLKTQASGRSSFMSGDMVSVSEERAVKDVNICQESGFDAFLKDVVQVPETVRTQVAHFLSDIVIVDSIRTALRLRGIYPERTFVTLDGDTLGRDGVLTGGRADSADSGVLKRRREIKELSLKREELSGKLQLAALTLDKLQQQEEGVKTQHEEAKKSAVEKEIRIAELRKDLERAEVELKNVQNACETEEKNSLQVEGQLAQLKTTLEELSAQMAQLSESKNLLESRVQELTSVLEESRSGFDQKNRSVTDLKIAFSSKKQEVDGLSREFMLVETALTDVLSQLAQMSEETERNANTLSEGQIAVEGLRLDLQRLMHQTQECEREVSSSRDEYERVGAEVRASEEQLSRNVHEMNQVRQTMSEAQIRMEQLKMRETVLVEQVRERYMLELSEIAANYRDQVGDVEQYARDIEDLRDKIKRIGDVNLAAIQEYDEVIKRYEFLSQQHSDLLEAKEHLRKVIERINRICSRRFKETFDQVNERFQKVFPVLFGGGEAMLVLVDGKDIEDPGIEIVARPPGKKLQNVSLLSGGEKALTAVSLIFSIFLVKPSPFCLLDEVDAPLDDANVMRFNDLVKEMARRSQIIVVTHNKHTMKVNNKLYGVTMQEKGVSKMVSVSLADAEKMALS